MGSSCSSAQKKKEKQKQKSGQSPVDGSRRRSAESLPYGKVSPSNSRRPSFEPQSSTDQITNAADTTHVTKTPVNASLSQASSTAGGGSSSSPPPAGMVDTPITKDAPSVDMSDLPDLQQYSENVRNLIMGRFDGNGLTPKLQEIMLYVSADYNDTSVERSALMEQVFPSLRKYAAEKGYELNVADLHFGIPAFAIVDHSTRDLCIDTLKEWKSKKRLISLILFNDNLGEPLLPKSVVKPHFEAFLGVISAEENKNLFEKWYSLDENALPVSYVLKPVTSLLPEVTSAGEERKTALSQWADEYGKMLELLKSNLPDAEKNKYLLSILEEEMKTLVTSDDSQDSRRVLWMQRRFTHVSKPAVSSNSAAQFDSRRVDRAKVQLEDFLPDTQKLVLYVRYQEGGCITPESDAEHAKYIADLCSTLKEELVKTMDAVFEEDFMEEAITPYSGLEKPLYTELIQHHRKWCEINESSICPMPGLSRVQEHLLGHSAKPLVICGVEGCGKTHLIARCARECASWLPSAAVVIRFVGTTTESSSQKQLLRSILEQCCVLYGEHPSLASQSVQNWSSSFDTLMKKVSEARPLVIMIDGIDEISMDLLWLPKELPCYVKLVLTVRESSDELRQTKATLDEDCFFEFASFSPSMSLVEHQLGKNKRRLTSGQQEMLSSCFEAQQPSARYCQLVSLVAVSWPGDLGTDEITLEKTAEGILQQRLLYVESLVGSILLTTVLGLLLAAKQGLSESEITDILSCDENVLDYVFTNGAPALRRFPPVILVHLSKLVIPFLSRHVVGGKTLINFSSAVYRTAASTYVTKSVSDLGSFAQALADYFLGKWAEGKKKPTAAGDLKERFVLEQPLAHGSYPNRRKLDELPRQILQLDDSIRENFLFDATWLLYKFCGSDPYQFLDDVASYETKTASDTDEELKLLTSVIQLSSYALRCDGSQFFAQIYGRLQTTFSDPAAEGKYPFVKAIYERSCRPPLSTLLPVIPGCLASPTGFNGSDSENLDGTSCSDMSGLYTIKGDYTHMISLSCNRGELIVWNIYKQTSERKLTGINQPKDVKMLDRYRALVLCNRELKVYHLDKGSLVVKLKGVMNQKMAYYGLHDENYAVALSRNRMYVNMTNLTTGDLETTFKVGEDRFLNSLLVSANGRICVCGDETQKPFPLLVWDLASRKLVYDLRIPHHEFVTRLSAISDDGHYVVSVCRELHGASPNFIIVYDLQSGTLFKKWKPESSSCSIAISSQGGCVVNGLENTWVLVWDLSTGARRYTLRGHSAPADEIRVDEEGKRCLTYDSVGRDRSLRVWDVVKGECLAVFTPDQAFTCCELSLDGRAVILGVKGQKTISTLLLCQESTVEDMMPDSEEYGDVQYKNKCFDMSQE